MNRAELKTKAKGLIKGNLWYLLKPVIIIGLIVGLLEIIGVTLDKALGLAKVEYQTIGTYTFTTRTSGIFGSLLSAIGGFASSIFAVGYAKYVLSFVRGEKQTLNDIVEFIKKNWLIAFVVSLLTGLIIIGGFILLVIPGIIAAIGLCYYKEVCADNLEMSPTDIIKKAWNMTKGHKGELFVLGLSFIGWYLLVGFTFGILLIWLYPYITVTMTLAYEELKKTA